MGELTGFAKNLKKFRENQNLTQDKLAKSIGVSAQTISAYEKGGGEKGKNPTLEKVIDIADTLGISLDALCGRDFKGSSEAKTLGDIARLLCEMKRWYTVTFSEQQVLRKEKGFEEYYDTTPVIFFDTGPLRGFLKDYTKLWQLREEKTIDDTMFNDWIDMKIRSLDGISVSSQGFYEIEEDGELPF